MMTLTYLFHSGFAIEGQRCIVVIDYWRDSAGVMPALLASPKRLYVLSTHFHPDHYNSEVLEWKTAHPDTIYLFSKDILRHRRATRDQALWIAKGGTFEDEMLSVRAFGSTDFGVSFYLQMDGRTLFHAGDLNNWHWRDESTDDEVLHAEKMYLGELKDICKVVKHVDVAMFPVDARMGTGYMRGAEQFVERVPTGLFVPMHFSANGSSSAEAFRAIAEAHGCQFWTPKHAGESRGVEA